jgi:multiple sugar transport system permease protein
MTAPPPRARRASVRRTLTGLAFISPWLIGFLAFILYPMAASLYYSLCHFNVLSPPRFVGLANYWALLFEDEYFWQSVGNTAYMLLELPLSVVLGIGTALLLNRSTRGIGLLRTVYYLPYVVPSVSCALLWLWLLNADQGLVNALLSLLHIPGPAWLKDAAWAKPGLVMMDLWGVGGGTVIYLAALQNVPKHLSEAAELDGAGAWARFRHVTLPAISPCVFFLTVTGAIVILQYFTPAFVMTKGKPENATLFFGLYLFENAFEYFRMGYACAMAWVLLIISLIATYIVFRTSARWVYYEAEEGGS